MKRTTVMLPQDLKMRAVRFANDMGVSLGELIRESLESVLSRSKKKAATDDSLFSDNAVFKGKCPGDLSKNHDYYLYGGKQ